MGLAKLINISRLTALMGCVALYYYLQNVEMPSGKKKDANSGTFTEWLIEFCCHMHGTRLMCGKDGKFTDPFPIDQVDLEDTLAGCFYYSILIIFILWILTPLPAVLATIKMRLNFKKRIARRIEDNVEVPIFVSFLRAIRRRGERARYSEEPQHYA